MSVLYISDVTFSFEYEIHNHQLSTINIPKNEIRKIIIYEFFHKQAVRYLCYEMPLVFSKLASVEFQSFEI